MVINHNLPAIFANRQLKFTTWDVNKDIEKLSSGMKINRAGDDASGLAVSEKMRSQIRGLRRAEHNAEDGISFIQKAEILVRPGDWRPVFPVDGICDSRNESFRIVFSLNPDMDDMITIRVVDGQNNVGVYRTTF